MSATVIGIDLGTSAVRVVAIDLQGKIVAQATRSYPLLTPQPGWTEQHPTDWIRASLTALSEVAQQVKAVAAIGLSGQMHGMVALDADGEVIRPAILWNDQRTKAAVAAIETAIDRNELIQRTGNPAVTGFQLPKVVWLRQNEPEAFARTRHLLLPKDYLGYVLTGNLWTEPSDASGTGCLHLASRQWDRDLLQTLDLPLAWFPPVIDSRAIAGQLQPMIAAQVHLPAGTPVIAGAGDNAGSRDRLGHRFNPADAGQPQHRHLWGDLCSDRCATTRSARPCASVLSCRWWLSPAWGHLGGRWFAALVSRSICTTSQLRGVDAASGAISSGSKWGAVSAALGRGAIALS
jgi:xylulokinase